MSADRPTLSDEATVLGLVVGLSLLLIVRVVVPVDEVFRGGVVVLAGNDAYRYRYWLDLLLGSGRSPFDPFDLAQLPDGILDHDVMFVWATWLVAEVLGGSRTTGGQVLAWYPVVAALVSAGLVALLAILVTDDRRVGVLSVVLLALTPAHAYRTMLGFGDHHAFDYVALALTATALVWLVTRDAAEERPWGDRSWWLVVGVLGGAVAAQTLSWRGGPMLLAPLAAYVMAVTVSAVRADRSPLLETVGLLAGLALASGLAGFIHVGQNWAPAYRGFAPFLLFGLVAGVALVAELAHRRGWSWVEAGLGLPAVVALWAAIVRFGPPWMTRGLEGFVAFLERRGRQQELGIGEVFSLFGSLEAPVELFGLVLLVAIPVLVGVTLALVRVHDPGWLALVSYAWVFLALSTNRIRFTGQLALFVAVLTAVGLVWLAERMGRTAPLASAPWSRERRGHPWTPTAHPDPVRATGVVVLLVLLVTGLGVAQVPGTMDRITVDDETYAAARFVDGYAEANGMTYPENYVFSEWGRNRFYNYEVSGQSKSYGYARRNYRVFVSAQAPAGWYEELTDRVGFVVIRSSRFAYPDASIQLRLDLRYGSAGDGVPGLGHYRLVYRSDDGDLKVFALVPGARLVGNATANETLTVVTGVRVDGVAFAYRRHVETGPDGRYAVRLAYPGRYEVADRTVQVSERDVTEGRRVGG